MEKDPADDRNVHENHRQRLKNRFFKSGALDLEPHVLLELFLFGVIPRIDTNPVSHRLLERFGTLDGVFSAEAEELLAVPGVGAATADYIRRSAAGMTDGIVGAYDSASPMSFERAACIFIWSMRRDPSTRLMFILLDGKGALIRTERFRFSAADPDEVLRISESFAEAGASSVVIGVREGEDVPDCRSINERIPVGDVISIRGYSAVSLIF